MTTNPEAGMRLGLIGAKAASFENYEPELNTGCWLWAGSTIKGYGVRSYRENGRIVRYYMHREFFAKHVRDLLPGECVLHKCDTPTCVNPQHLFAGSQLDNIADMTAKRRYRGAGSQTTDPQGHPYDRISSRGLRICSVCARNARRKFKERTGR